MTATPLCEPFEFGDDPTALYRLYDIKGALLYVGITLAPTTRMATHRATQPWWAQVAKKTMVWYSRRAEACLAEEMAIQDEKPKCNAKMTTSSNARLVRLTDEVRGQVMAELDAAYEAGEPVPLGGGGTRRKITGANWGSATFT